MRHYDYTETEVRSKIQRKLWLKGVLYAIIDGRQRFNAEEIDAWTTQEVLGQEVTPSKSNILTTERGVAKSFKRSRNKTNIAYAARIVS